MSEQIKAKIISHLQSGGYQPTKPLRCLAAGNCRWNRKSITRHFGWRIKRNS